MRRIKGLHDIATHGSLAREGRLISVARGDFFKTASPRNDAGGITSDWDVKRHIFQKPKSSFNFVKLAKREIDFTQGILNEFDEAFQEGLPVSNEAREQLRARLTRLKRWWN